MLIEHEAVAEAAVVPSPDPRLEFAELPKTISGKIRRVELRTAEQKRLPGGAPPPERARGEFWEEDFPELRR